MQQKDRQLKAPAASGGKTSISGSPQPSLSNAERPAALPADPFFFLKQNAVSVKEAETASELLALNRETREHGLTLTADEARSLAESGTQALTDNRRFEFGSSALPMLARTFATSPYVNQREWFETLTRLCDMFYRFKSETYERLGDAELTEIMRDAFDGSCHGSLELLEGRELERLARRVRSGYAPSTAPEDDAPDDCGFDYDEGDDDDGFMPQRQLF